MAAIPTSTSSIATSKPQVSCPFVSWSRANSCAIHSRQTQGSAWIHNTVDVPVQHADVGKDQQTYLCKQWSLGVSQDAVWYMPIARNQIINE
eukprot:scaffold30101_cov43-Prasinocladus_malaysianus.AAC.3